MKCSTTAVETFDQFGLAAHGVAAAPRADGGIETNSELEQMSADCHVGTVEGARARLAFGLVRIAEGEDGTRWRPLNPIRRCRLPSRHDYAAEHRVGRLGVGGLAETNQPVGAREHVVVRENGKIPFQMAQARIEREILPWPRLKFINEREAGLE